MNNGLLKTTVMFICLTSVLAVAYLALDTRGFSRFGEVPGRSNYNLLGRALASGRLSLPYEVPPERAKAADPIDPRLSSEYLMDATIYKGHYYFLQEPLPGLLHALWIKATGADLPTGVVVVAGAWGCLIVLFVLLSLLRREFFPSSPRRLVWYAAFCFGLSAPQLYVAAKPTVYHESIVCGVFFVLCGSLSFAVGIIRERRSGLPYLLAGIFFGCAFLCRVTLILYPFGFLVCLGVRQIYSDNSLRDLLGRGVAMGLPVLAAVGILMVYNYLRFGDYLDFGRRHIMYPWYSVYEYVCLQGNAFRIAHVPYNLSAYLLSLPELSWRHSLPWLRFTRELSDLGSVVMGKEQTASVLILMPALVLVAPFQRLLGPLKWDRRLKTLLWAFCLSSVVMFAMFTFYFYAVPRYLYESTTLLFVVMFCNIAGTWEKLQARAGLRGIFVAALLLLLALNALMGIYLGLNAMVQLK